MLLLAVSSLSGSFCLFAGAGKEEKAEAKEIDGVIRAIAKEAKDMAKEAMDTAEDAKDIAVISAESAEAGTKKTVATESVEVHKQLSKELPVMITTLDITIQAIQAYEVNSKKNTGIPEPLMIAKKSIESAYQRLQDQNFDIGTKFEEVRTVEAEPKTVAVIANFPSEIVVEQDLKAQDFNPVTAGDKVDVIAPIAAASVASSAAVAATVESDDASGTVSSSATKTASSTAKKSTKLIRSRTARTLSGRSATTRSTSKTSKKASSKSSSSQKQTSRRASKTSAR